MDEGSEGDGRRRRGWALLRASLHDPLLVLNVESDVDGGERCVCDGRALGARGWGGQRGLGERGLRDPLVVFERRERRRRR